MGERGTIIGLDVGRYALKAVWAEWRGGGPVIRRAEILRLPQDASDALGVIRPWAEKQRLSRYPCVLGVPGSDAIFQPLVLPPADPRTLDQAAAIEVVRFNEMASETMVHGYLPFPGNPGERRLLMAMARPSVVDPLLSLARDLHLDLLDLIPTPAALYAALSGPSGDPAGPVAYADIGHAATSVAIGSASNLCFARAFAGGGQLFTEALVRRRNLTDSQADAFKTESATLETPGDVREALEEAAAVWLSEVQSCLSVYASLFPTRDMRLSRIVVAGGASRLRGFVPYVASKLDLPVSAADQLPGNPSQAQPETFATALGLAGLGFRPAAQRLSLLPHTLRDEQQFRRQKPYWVASAAVAALTLVISLAGGARDIRRKEAHMRGEQVRLARRQQLADKIDAVKGRAEQIQAMGGPIQAMLATGPRFRDLLTAFATALPPGGSDWISMVSDADSYFSKTPFSTRRSKAEDEPRDAARGGAPEDEPPGPISSVIVEGYTRTPDFSTVRSLILKLAELDFVSGADLLSDDKLVVSTNKEPVVLQGGTYRFVIEIRMRTP